MLPASINSSTFTETQRNQPQPQRTFENNDKYLILDIYLNQSHNLGFRVDAPKGTSPQFTLPQSFDSIGCSPFSVQMTSKSTQEENDNASRRVSNSSWIAIDAHIPLVEPSLFSESQFPNPTVYGQLHAVNPLGALARKFSKGRRNQSTSSVTESFVAAAIGSDWIDLEPTPLPSGFSTKRKNASISRVDSQQQYTQSKSLSAISNEKSMNTSFMYDSANTHRGDETSIVSSSDSGRASPTSATPDLNDSLLHDSCRLYPTTRAVVESALRLNPSSIRQRRNPPKSSPQFSRKELRTPVRANASPYPTGCTIPLNIALENGASFEVVKLLVDECPEVILAEDGPQGCGSLSVALYHSSANDIVLALIAIKPESVKMVDRRHSNLPLHVACAKGASFEVIQSLVQLFPKALHHRNFHGQTPLDICQRHSSVCSDSVTDFLQEATFRNISSDLETILDDALNVGDNKE